MRISTGIPSLDLMMDGGFIEGTFNMVSGPQGAGKTIFALNFITHHASQGRDVLYISLEEAWDDIVRNLPPGIKERMKDQRIHYLDFSSIRPFLGKKALDVELLSEVIITSMTIHNAKILVIDGIAPLAPVDGSPQELRNTLFELSKRLKKAGGTILFTSERFGEGAGRFGVEEYVADSVLLLHYDGMRRRIQVLKMRGSDFVYGLHGFKISQDGVNVYPRILPVENGSRKPARENFGIKGMESIMGNVHRGDLILITGPPGTGKTIMAYHFLQEAARKGEKTLYVSFKDLPDTVRRKAKEFGISLKGMEIIHRDLMDIDPYELLWDVYTRTKDVTRVVADGLGDMKISKELEDAQHTLLKNLKRRGITVLVTHTTSEIISSYKLATPLINFLANEIINVRYAEIEGEIRKIMIIIKSREKEHEKGIIEYEIGDRGITILGKPEFMEGLMSGLPRHVEMKKRVEKFFK